MDRFSSIVSLSQYSKNYQPLFVGVPEFSPPPQDQYILRMLIDSPYSGFQLPEELAWTLPIIDMARDYQLSQVGIRHPFTYLTVRHGLVRTKTDAAWHVDGFSVRYNHLPEANYLIVSHSGTHYAPRPFVFPSDFDPLRHNVHSFFARRIRDFKSINQGQLYLLDPYVVHRRPPRIVGMQRTLVRASFIPIEIPDINNTRNPLIATPHYVIDGIKGFRNNLITYDR